MDRYQRPLTMYQRPLPEMVLAQKWWVEIRHPFAHGFSSKIGPLTGGIVPTDVGTNGWPRYFVVAQIIFFLSSGTRTRIVTYFPKSERRKTVFLALVTVRMEVQ